MRNKILFILPFLPYPRTSGGHQALYNGITSVSDDLDISITYFANNDANHKKALNEFKHILPYAKFYPCFSTKQRKSILLVRVIKRLIIIINSLFKKNKEEYNNNQIQWWKTTITPERKEWILHLNNLFNKHSFDLIQVEMPWMIANIFSLPDNVAKIYVHHELGFVRREQEIKMMNDFPYANTYKKFVDFNEIGQLNLYDGIITLSTIDKLKLEKAGITKPIFPSFAIVNTNKNIEKITNSTKRLTFVGPDAHAPNLDGITWFLDNCWAELRKYDPDYTLDIIGRWSTSNIKQFTIKYPNVSFMGYVDDLYKALKGSVMIVPIRIGSGIRMKILEACSLGIPFISTSVGAEGIPLKDEHDCFIKNEPHELIKAIKTLEDPNLQNLFVENAYKMVKQYYSLESLRNNRLEIYEMILRK